MKVRVKINAIVEVPGDVLPRCAVLDLVEHGVTAIKATEILPGARVSLSRTTQKRKSK